MAGAAAVAAVGSMAVAGVSTAVAGVSTAVAGVSTAVAEASTAVAAFMAAVLAGLPDSTAATASVGASMAFATEITSGAFATEITSGGLVAGSESITDMATIRTMATTTPANILLPRCGTTAPILRAINPTYRNATPAGRPSPVASRCRVAPASRVATFHVLSDRHAGKCQVL